MNDEQYWNLICRYLADDLSIEETDELLQWLDEDPSRGELLTELQEAWDKSKSYPSNIFVDTNGALLRVKSSFAFSPSAEVRVKFLSFIRVIQLLAVVFGLFSIGFIAFHYLKKDPIIKIETFSGEYKEIILPDGSRVWLNELSSLAYPSNLAIKGVRQVELHGEAFFEIKKDEEKRFFIGSGKTKIEVLGTSLDVLQDKNGNVKVAVVNGNASFQSEEKPNLQLILEPGDEGVIYRSGYVTKMKYKNNNFLYWKNKKLTFKNSSLSEVIRTIEEAYHTKFYVQDSVNLQRLITASFKQESLNQVINKFESSSGLKVIKAGSGYIIENHKQSTNQ